MDSKHHIFVSWLLVFLLGGFLMATDLTYQSFPFPIRIVSVDLLDGKLVVVKSQEVWPTHMTLEYPSKPIQGKLHVWKEIYIAKNGEIVLEKIVEAKVIPAQDEKWEWPDNG